MFDFLPTTHMRDIINLSFLVLLLSTSDAFIASSTFIFRHDVPHIGTKDMVIHHFQTTLNSSSSSHSCKFIDDVFGGSGGGGVWKLMKKKKTITSMSTLYLSKFHIDGDENPFVTSNVIIGILD